MTKDLLWRHSLQIIHQTIYGHFVPFAGHEGLESGVRFCPATKTVDGYRDIPATADYTAGGLGAPAAGTLTSTVPIEVVHWTIANSTGEINMIDQWRYGLTTYMRP